MSIRIRFINLISKIATGRKGIRYLLTPFGGIFFLVMLCLFIFGSRFLDSFFGFPQFPFSPLHIYLSLPIISSGFLLALWSITHFLKAHGTPVPINPPSKLVTTGPYAFMRNPMLSGIFIGTFGLGILLRSISLVVILNPLFILLMVVELKVIEEPELENRLGKVYKEYKKKVPMFLPFLSLRK
jgi:protein-S-isoprenylcysteine O-methyltransferase Ste14